MFAGPNEERHTLIVLTGIDFVEAIAAFLAQQPGLTDRRTVTGGPKTVGNPGVKGGRHRCLTMGAAAARDS